MADTKITALTAIGANPIIPSTFPIPMVDLTDTSMAASGTTKKVTVNQILGAGGTATLASATITGDLTVDTSTLKVNSTANRVGILTASPESELDVRGLIAVRGTPTFPSTGVGLEAYYSTSNTSTYLQSYDRTGGAFANLSYNALAHIFQNSGSTAMTLNSTGLGIGATPSKPLHVYNTTESTVWANTTTGISLFRAGGTGGDFYFGIDNSTGGGFGQGNYSRLIYSTGAYPIIFSTNATQRMQIDSSGNVGIGVTPSAWGTSGNIQLPAGAGNSGIFTSNRYALFGSNAYNNAGWKYIASQAAALYLQDTGSHAWFITGAGTAGNAITWTQAMTLDASGNLLVGTTATGGSASNSAKIVGGFFSSVNASTASTASGSAVTLFAAPNEAVFIVSAYIFGTGSPSAYNAVAIVKVSGASATVTTISSATGLSLSVSGLNVQATQTSGSSQVIVYSAIRIS